MRNILLGILSLSAVTASAQKQPNIIFILADDMGYGDLGCYGSASIETPNIDALASQGKRFTRFYAGSAVSTPSRVTLMTGKFPIRYDVQHVFRDKHEYLLQENFIIPKMLKEAGYQTAHIGKWHLGGVRSFDIDRRKSGIATIPGPLQQGFDHSLTTIEGTNPRRELMLSDRMYKESGLHLIRNDRYAIADSAHWEDIKTNEALSLMDQYAKNDKPFFINLWYDSPHDPYELAPSDNIAKYEDMGVTGDQLLFRTMVSHLDKNIGKIQAKLKELGIYDNTIIVFTSDNGPARQGCSGPFKGGKSDLHEGGIRVPCFVVWNGVIPSATISHDVCHFADFLPTFYEIVNGKQTTIKGDGESLLAQLKKDGNVYTKRNKKLFFQLKKSGSSQLQAPRPLPHISIAVIDEKWKLTADIIGGKIKPLELFDLMTDQRELKNLLGTQLEIEKELFLFMEEVVNNERKHWDRELGFDDMNDLR